MNIDTICSNFKERCLYSISPRTGHSEFLPSHRYALVTLNLSIKASMSYLWGLLLCARILLCSFLPLFSCLSVCWNISKLKCKKATPSEQVSTWGVNAAYLLSVKLKPFLTSKSWPRQMSPKCAKMHRLSHRQASDWIKKHQYCWYYKNNQGVTCLSHS